VKVRLYCPGGYDSHDYFQLAHLVMVGSAQRASARLALNVLFETFGEARRADHNKMK
jgi:hypothetical protein